MTSEYASLKDFLVTNLSFVSIKTGGMHTFLAPKLEWQRSHNRSDQPLLIRVNTAPGGKDLEVAILFANIPMVKLSARLVRLLEPSMIDRLVARGNATKLLLQQERHSVFSLLHGLLPSETEVIEINT